ncbi:Cyclophilin-like domain containing protein [Russula decolorans]
MASAQRPIIFMDININIGEMPAGRLKMELFSDIVPKYLCSGEYRVNSRLHSLQGYKIATFHRVKGGGFLKGDGTGSFSIYWLLSMVDDITSGLIFFVTAPCDFLDGKHVVFGKVIDGMLTLRKIENVPTGPNNRPKLVVKITECGEM